MSAIVGMQTAKPAKNAARGAPRSAPIMRQIELANSAMYRVGPRTKPPGGQGGRHVSKLLEPGTRDPLCKAKTR